MIWYLGLSALLVGCGAALEGAPAEPRPGDAGAALDGAAGAESAAPASSLAAMTERMLCGGPCRPGALGGTGESEVRLVLSRPHPAYEVTIRADGAVLYQGYRFVKVRGPAEGHISPAEVQKLVHRFEGAGFQFNARDLSASPCGQAVTDQPATTLTLFRGRRQLRVIHYACEGGPLQVADEIDRVVGTDRWTRCEAETPGPCER